MRALVTYFAASFLSALIGASAWATDPARLYVSGLGDDNASCSRTAPCKTFAAAIAKAYEGAEINCLDPAGYGPVTITKSISISCEAGTAGILINSGYAITVNAGPDDVVYLKGLDIDGSAAGSAGHTGTAQAGIRVNSVGSIFIEDCVIRNFKASGGGFGIQFASSNSMKFLVSRCSIFNTGMGNLGAAIQVRPVAAVSVEGVIDRVLASKGVYGFAVDGNGAAANLNVTIRDSVATEFSAIAIVSTTFANPAAALVERTSAVNSNIGIGIIGTGATVRVGDSSITGNSTGVSGSGVQSYGTNKLNANNTDGVVSPIPLR